MHAVARTALADERRAGTADAGAAGRGAHASCDLQPSCLLLHACLTNSDARSSWVRITAYVINSTGRDTVVNTVEATRYCMPIIL